MDYHRHARLTVISREQVSKKGFREREDGHAYGPLLFVIVNAALLVWMGNSGHEDAGKQ